MRIRTAIQADLHTIARIYVDSWQSTYAGILSQELLAAMNYQDAEKQWGGYLNRADRCLFVAEEDKTVSAFLACSTSAAELGHPVSGYVEALHVAAAKKGNGMGGALLRTAARWLQEAGRASLALAAIEGNDKAIQIYQHMGGRIVACQHQSYDDVPARDVVFLWEDITALL